QPADDSRILRRRAARSGFSFERARVRSFEPGILRFALTPCRTRALAPSKRTNGWVWRLTCGGTSNGVIPFSRGGLMKRKEITVAGADDLKDGEMKQVNAGGRSILLARVTGKDVGGGGVCADYAGA